MVPEVSVYYRIDDEDFKRRKREGRCTFCDAPGKDGRPPHIWLHCPLKRAGKPPKDHKPPKAGQ